MPEQQNIEWKEKWKDEYLKWICGFANAKGGNLFIGKNDNGKVTGLDNYQKLMEDIPNKIQNYLGIICNVNLHQENEKYFIEIETEPYPYPISYKGQYHYRSGSTKQELKGIALDKFLLNKQGKCWDSVPIPNVKIEDLKQETLQLFRKKAYNSKRVNDSILKDDDKTIIENLDLNENEYLKRAAILLFHPKPEKFITGAYIKIGYFETDDDLRFQNVVYGNLFEQIEQALDLIKDKYLKAYIHYEGIDRIEEYIFPEPAIREALLNAVCHKDYSSNTPIQIRIYENKIIFWNSGQLPESWTIEKLTVRHPSQPFNPDIANAFFRAGYVEAWGRGTINMINECKENGILPPRFTYDFSGFIVEFFKYTENDLKQKYLKDWQIKIILHIQDKGAISNNEVQNICNVSKRTASSYLSELEGVYVNKIGKTGKGTSYVLKGQ